MNLVTGVDMIEIERIEESRINEVDFDNIPFGKTFSDHMFVAEYKDGNWHSAKAQVH